MLACPACGSYNIIEKWRDGQYTAPFGPTVTYKVAVHTCLSCNSERDFVSANDTTIEAAIRKADEASHTMMLDRLAMLGLSAVSLERCYRLPFGSLKVFNPANLVILRLTCMQPWLATLAGNGYKEKE